MDSTGGWTGHRLDDDRLRIEGGTLQASAAALGAADTKTIEYSGAGKWFQFGQAPNPTLPWPAFDVSAYTASINYDTLPRVSR
jgi:hypothetical protein